MNPLWLGFGAATLYFLLNLGGRKAAKLYSPAEATEALGELVERKSPSPAGTISVSSQLGGVTYRYLGHDRGREEMAPQMALLLARLGSYLRDQYGVVAIDHAGIYPGSSENPGETHNRGMAADLSVFHFRDGSKLSVLEDWGKKPKRGTGYRLTSRDKGYRFFQDVFDFLSKEGEGQRRIGDKGYLLTPDHPDAALAEAHKNHFHVQIGPTLL